MNDKECSLYVTLMSALVTLPFKEAKRGLFL